MSLINKMLQDLDERRAESGGMNTFDSQVRVTPGRKPIHAAWWIVLGLTLLLSAVIAWAWKNKTAPAAVLSLPVPQVVMPPPRVMASAQPSVLVRPAVEPAIAVAAAPALPVEPARPGPAEPPAEAPVLAAIRPMSDAPARITASARSKAASLPEAPEKPSAPEIPATVSKQINAASPQQRADNEYRKASALMQAGKTADAAGVLEQVLQIDPLYSVARQSLAGLLLEMKRIDDAIRILQEGLVLEPRQPELAMMLARLQVEKGELGLAIATLQRSLPHASERADYQAFLAALFQRDTQHREAIDHFLIALRKSPQNGLWWMGLAISLQAENRLSEARDAFARAGASNTLSPPLQAFVEQKMVQLR
ncbi:MAG: tetratricopeptide repeat protein [Pseudomonadota bacterium]